MFRPVHTLAALSLGLLSNSGAHVILNEIHYNPVERPAFNANGDAVFQGTNTPADFADDVHEFVEVHNPTGEAVNLSGWRLAGGIDFTFPNGTSLPAAGYLVVAKNAVRIQSVYSISGVLGPYSGKLGNRGDTVRLLTPTNVAADAVSYQSAFPWAISANRLGAADDFTLLNSATYQYKGRSLQRVSATAGSNDPANWVAVRPASGPTTFADLPTPGAANLVVRPEPKPVATAISATQLGDGAAIIRSTSQARILATFSTATALSDVQLEYFIDNINAWGESRSTLAMAPLGNNQFSATIPQQTDRSIVRYRIKANRGDGIEVVSPRADDPAIVPIAMTQREAWHSYFVTPTRSSSKPIYDCFVANDGQPITDTVNGNIYPFNGLNGLQNLAYNAMGDLKRVNGGLSVNVYPRELGWPGVTATSRIWNGTVPGVFIENGNVRDVQVRFHGSRYNRRPSRKSYKLLFSDYQLYQRADSVFITDKGDPFMTAHGLHQLAGLPLSHVRYVDWYFNADPAQTRLEQGEYNGDLLDIYHEKVQRLNPGSVLEETGELYKSVGVILNGGNATFPGGTPSGGEGPYGQANGWQLPATGGSPAWTELQRYDYSFGLQNHAWKGSKPIRDLTNGMWAARGDSYATPGPNVANLRAWLQQNWDIETELTSLALGNWMCPWDDTTQNYFLWRRASGRWARLLWDFDAMYGGNSPFNSSIYHGEVGDPANNFRGPNYYKDSFIKAFREEYKQRLWFLNNTLLDPDNLGVLTFQNGGGGTASYAASIGGFATSRFDYVNTQVNLGVFYKPTRPTHSQPANGSAALPGANLTASAYNYRAARTLAVPPAVSPHTTSKWEIRSAAGTYDDPVFALTSPTDLTSLPIPFEQLTYGQTYFWRVTYFDALGHPSITSAETSFSYGPSSTSAGNVTINEIMAENLTAVSNGADRPDYIELKNTTAAAIDISGWKLTDDEFVPGKYIFPASTTIPAGGYLIVWCDANTASPGLHSGFGLSRQGQRVLLITNKNVVRDAMTFGPQAPNTAIGRVSDGVGAWTLVNASPAASNTARAFSTATSTLKINEWMAVPAAGEDWFEIYNPGTLPVALAGLWLSDTTATPKLTQIPPLSFVAGGGCVRFDADGTTRGFNSVNFKLTSGGEQIILSTTNGLTAIDSITFDAQQPGVSEGRFPDGATPFVAFPLSPSPNDNNWLPAPALINEALSSSVAPLEDYVEIHNPTENPVNIGLWWLSDDQSAKQKFQFPADTIVPPGGYLVVLESEFNVGANAFGLSSTGDELVLSAADANGNLTGYRSQFNFGASADGVSFGYVPTATVPEFWPQVSRTSGAANSAPFIGPIIINEVHYHPPDLFAADNARDEFVELHNVSRAAVDLTGWQLKGESDFTFAAGTTIESAAYILVVGFDPVADPATRDAFRAALNVPANVPIYGPFTPRLGNSSASVEIAYPFTPEGGTARLVNVDKVEYADFFPWVAAADGNGPSLQRISRDSIGNDAANWTGATPTPGAVNPGQAPLLFAPLFTQQPQSQAVNPGTVVTFIAVAHGTAPVTYQWRKDGVALENETSNQLQFTAMEALEGIYDVVATNAIASVPSDPAVLSINEPVVITDEPDSQTVLRGALVTFSVGHTGSAPISYQWRKNTVPIGGATGPQLSFDAAAGAEGTYDILITNAVGTVPSAQAVLTVLDPIVISGHPTPKTVNPNAQVTFSVAATGTAPLTYQWRKNTEPINGATDAVFTIDSAKETDEGSYDVIVTNPAGSVPSESAVLTVNNAVQITNHPAPVVIGPSGQAAFSVTATGSGTLSYQWRRNQNPIPGANASTLSISSVNSEHLGTYDVVVTNFLGDETSNPAQLSFVDWNAAAGVYQGIFHGPDPGDPAKHPVAGRATVTMLKTGKCSGKLEYFGVQHSFRGEFDADLNATILVTRRTDTIVTLIVHLNGIDKTLEIAATHVSPEGPYAANAIAPHIPKRLRTAPAPLAGQYTAVVDPGSGSPADLRAPGFVTMKIAKSGAVSWAGKLPDTTALRGSALLSPADNVAFYNRLYPAKLPLAGHIGGPLIVTAAGLSGDLAWLKPPQIKGDFWRSGIQALVTATGSRWVAPLRSAPILPISPMTFRIDSASSETLQDYPLTFTPRSTFAFDPNAAKLSVKVNRATGLLSGSYLDSGQSRAQKLYGVYLQNEARGDGFSPGAGSVRVWELITPP